MSAAAAREPYARAIVTSLNNASLVTSCAGNIGGKAGGGGLYSIIPGIASGQVLYCA